MNSPRTSGYKKLYLEPPAAEHKPIARPALLCPGCHDIKCQRQEDEERRADEEESRRLAAEMAAEGGDGDGGDGV